MSNFAINFQHPWFLFALLLGLVLALVPHFRIAKKYRRNRNRIVSLVFHIIVIFLSTFLLAGMTFDYTVKNDQNEILLLVDMSDSEERVEEDRDTFVDTVLRDYEKLYPLIFHCHLLLKYRCARNLM